MATTFRENNAKAHTLRDSLRLFGLGPEPSEEEINAAFRRLSKHAHPDTGGTPERFDELRSARELLLRAARAEAWNPVSQPPTQPMPAPGPGPGPDGRFDLHSLFDGSQPVWVLGTLVSLPVVILGAIAAIIRLDRSLIAASLIAGISVWIVAAVLVSVVRQHRTNTRPEVLYRPAEEVVRLRANRIRAEYRRRQAEEQTD